MKQIIKCVLWVLLNFVLQFVVQLGMTICAVAGGISDDAALALMLLWCRKKLDT